MSKLIDWDRTSDVWAATPSVVAAWAFGSAHDGKVEPGSDVDIAVLLVSQPTLDERIELLSRLQAALQVEDIDLVVLNGADPIVRFEAMLGRSLFCRDLVRRAEFASLTAREYEDEMAFLQRALKNA